MIHYRARPGPSAARDGWEIQVLDVPEPGDARALEYLERKASESRPGFFYAFWFAFGGFAGSLSVLLIK